MLLLIIETFSLEVVRSGPSLMDLLFTTTHTSLIDDLELCGLLLEFCDVFNSCLNSGSHGTHSVQRIHWCASDIMLHFYKSVLMKKQAHLHLGWPEHI